jgi:hypothetical protein
MSVPDAIAPIVAYRRWAPGFGQLWSSHGPGRERWPRTEPLRAICLRHGVPSCFNHRMPEHTAPEQGCTCGIYGVFAPWDLEFDEPRKPAHRLAEERRRFTPQKPARQKKRP